MASKASKTKGAASASVEVLDVPIYIPELEDIKVQSVCRKWTEYEENILKAYYGKVPAKKLAQYFAKDEKCLNRTAHAIDQKANALGLSR